MSNPGGLLAAAIPTARAQTPPIGADSAALLKLAARERARRAIKTADTSTDDARSRALKYSADAVGWAAQSGDPLAEADVWHTASRVYNRYKLADSAAAATTQSFAAAREAVVRGARAGDTIAEGRARLFLSDLHSVRDSARAERTLAVQLYEAAGAWNLAADEIGSLGYTWEVGADSAAKVAAHARRLRRWPTRWPAPWTP